MVFKNGKLFEGREEKGRGGEEGEVRESGGGEGGEESRREVKGGG